MHTQSILVTGPTDDPVTVDDAKCQVTQDETHDDLYIQSLVRAATAAAETYTRRAFVSQTWRQEFSHWANVMRLRRPNLASVTSVQYYDEDDVIQTLGLANYLVDTTATPGAIRRTVNGSYPSLSSRDFPVVVTFVAGYGAASVVPQDVKHAVLLMVGHLYMNREATTASRDFRTLPLGYEELLNPHRIPDIG